MKRRRDKDLAHLSSRHLKRLITESVKAAAESKSLHAADPVDPAGSSSPPPGPSLNARILSPIPPVSSQSLPCFSSTAHPPCSGSCAATQIELNLTAGFLPDQSFEICGHDWGSTGGCDTGNSNDSSGVDSEFLQAVLKDKTFDDYLLICEDCERCGMCSCLLNCEICDHSLGLGTCLHCDKCNSDWISITEGEIDSEKANESDTSVSDSEVEIPLRDELAEWAAETPNLSHVACKKLLGILRKYHPDDNLPSDPRTLLHTARSVHIREMPPGHYWHCGLKNHLLKQFAGSEEETIKLTFNMDGLPISQSSGSTVWPILCSASGSSSEGEVFVCGIFHGYSKPDSSNDYLRELKEELVDLIHNGLDINGKHFNVCLWCFICDAPAKAFILYIKSHNGYFSCSKCFQRGKMVGRRMCFPEIDFVKRTDQSFIDKEQRGHHIEGETSILTEIPNIKLVTSFVLDPMHLLYIGTMKKLLLLWTIGDLNVRMGKSLFKEISALLVKLARFIPVEFARKTRPLDVLRRYKAAELRLLLDYVGPVAFRKLPPHIYENYLCLHFAVRLLSCSDTCINFNEYAGELMKLFVTNFKAIYGEQFVSHNIHGCLHIHNDVLEYGCLDQFSAFKFESFLQKLKKMIRKGDKPLQQIAKRYSEKSAVGKNKSKTEKSDGFFKEHNGPLVPGCGNPQYAVFMWKGFELNALREADNCVTLNYGTVVVVRNFAYHTDKKSMVIVGSKYLQKEDLYTYPCPSSSAGIFKVHHLSPLKHWPIEMISQKCVKFPYSETSTAILPLLHKEKCKF